MSYPELKGKTFIVTGGASGMGRTTALELAKQGSNVGLLDLSKPDNVLAEIEKIGGKAISIACNVQDSRAVGDAIKAVADHFGALHGAANMAGYVGNQGLAGRAYSIDVITDADWDGMMATNINGVKNCIQAEFNHMKQGGSIVNASSISGQTGTPFNSPYSASKWAVIGLSKSAAQEGGAKGIRVNAIAP
jgi:3-oxoacyl-[acyl-carrier protein] reductase